MHATYTDPAVARLTRRRKSVPLWFWLAILGAVSLVAIASVAAFTSWSPLHPLETAQERAFRVYLEGYFTPFTIEEIQPYRGDEYAVKIRRPDGIVGTYTETHYLYYDSQGNVSCDYNPGIADRWQRH